MSEFTVSIDCGLKLKTIVPGFVGHENVICVGLLLFGEICRIIEDSMNILYSSTRIINDYKIQRTAVTLITRSPERETVRQWSKEEENMCTFTSIWGMGIVLKFNNFQTMCREWA